MTALQELLVVFIKKDFKYNKELFNETEDEKKGFLVEEFAGMPIENIYSTLTDEEMAVVMVQLAYI